MKKLLCFALVCSLLLCSCGNKKWVPETASSTIKPYAERAIEIIDGYLSFNLSAKEATDSMKTLADRIESFDISYTSEDYTWADANISHYITMLSIGDFDRNTDIELKEYRDLLNFQLTGQVGERTYNPDTSSFSDEDNFSILGNLSSKVSSFSSYESGVSVSFDYINGVSTLDFSSFVETLNTSFWTQTSVDSITISYYCYEQMVINVSMVRSNISPAFILSTNGSYQRYDSFEELSSAIEKAVKIFPYK